VRPFTPAITIDQRTIAISFARRPARMITAASLDHAADIDSGERRLGLGVREP